MGIPKLDMEKVRKKGEEDLQLADIAPNTALPLPSKKEQEEDEANKIVLEEMSRTVMIQDSSSLDLGPNTFAIRVNQYAGSF